MIHGNELFSMIHINREFTTTFKWSRRCFLLVTSHILKYLSFSTLAHFKRKSQVLNKGSVVSADSSNSSRLTLLIK